MIKEKMKYMFDTFQDGYGKEDAKKLACTYIIASCMMIVMLFLVQGAMPEIIAKYFKILTLLLIINFICNFFYRKNTHTDRWKRTKTRIAIFFIVVLTIAMMPALIVLAIVNWVANTTKKSHLLIKHPYCFLMEVLLRPIFICAMIMQTLEKPDDIVWLIITCVVYFVFDKLFTGIARRILIGGEYKYYERFCYKNEIEIVNEYLFLIASTISILCSATEYSNAFIPILVWYSLKQIKKYRSERKQTKWERRFLLGMLDKIQEIKEVYLVSYTGELDIKECLQYNEIEIECYRLNNSNKLRANRRKKKMDEALNGIKSLYETKYTLPEQKEKADKDMDRVLNCIVRCI